jgi:hypothetical protein
MPNRGWPREGSRGGALAILLALAACGDDERPLDPVVCSSTVERVELAVVGRQPLPRIGDVLRIFVSAVDDCDRPVTFTESSWSTSDASVVTARAGLAQIGDDGEPFEVPGEGLVRAVGFGTTMVRVEVAGVTADLAVEVVRPATRAEGLEVLGAGSAPRPVHARLLGSGAPGTPHRTDRGAVGRGVGGQFDRRSPSRTESPPRLPDQGPGKPPDHRSEEGEPGEWFADPGAELIGDPEADEGNEPEERGTDQGAEQGAAEEVGRHGIPTYHLIGGAAGDLRRGHSSRPTRRNRGREGA